MNPNKIIKGKRPVIYETPGVDYLMHMVMVLAQELAVSRDRLDTLEQVAAENACFTQADIEGYRPSQAVLEKREADRQQLFSSLFSILSQEAADLQNGETDKKFKQVIAELAKEQ